MNSCPVAHVTVMTTTKITGYATATIAACVVYLFHVSTFNGLLAVIDHIIYLFYCFRMLTFVFGSKFVFALYYTTQLNVGKHKLNSFQQNG